MLWQRSRQSGSLVADTCARAGWVRSTAAKYSSGATLPRYAESPSAARACSTPVGDDVARGSGRRVDGTVAVVAFAVALTCLDSTAELPCV
jgi:hypothetical protein